jgi:CRP/FNR family transcriptional regulator, anaerobic regulatory protein
MLADARRSETCNSDIPANCRACDARADGICGAMTPAQLTELSRYTVRKKIECGSELHGQGEPVISYANILRGVVKLSKVLPDGRQQIVGLQFAPDFIGRPFARESALNAEAATDLEICTVSKSALERIVGRNPDLERRLHDQALAELDDARDWMLTLGRKTAKEKVASFLHFLAMHYDPDAEDAVEFDIPLTRQDIADFLGLTIETVSRQMTRLRQDGVISVVDNRKVTVADPDRLAAAARAD